MIKVVFLYRRPNFTTFGELGTPPFLGCRIISSGERGRPSHFFGGDRLVPT